jgi:3-oxoacyl-(acyl-carrier-protein) synthase
MISSSANGSKNDEKLINVYKNVFTNELNNISITAHKQYFGECYGASGALQIASCLSNCKTGKISSINSDNLIDDLPSFSNKVIDKKIKYFIVDGISCEGNCTVLVFKNVID